MSNTKKPNPDYTIKFVVTPKCKDCNPRPEMLKRKSCEGCRNIMNKKKK